MVYSPLYVNVRKFNKTMTFSAKALVEGGSGVTTLEQFVKGKR